MKKVSEVISYIDKSKKDIEILPTGFTMLDEYLEGGFLKKEFVVIGAPTGKGKSLFGGTLFYNIASKGYKCGYFSLEISNEMIVSRLLGAESNISPTKIMIKMLNEKEELGKEDAEAKLSVYEEFMHFYDDIYEIANIKKLIEKEKYDFVVIDFIQHLSAPQFREERERLDFIARELQIIAKENNCCILGLSQLSNQISRNKKDTDIVEYRGSGSIAIACDLGFFIEDTAVENTARIRLRKNRRGISGEAFSFSIKQPGGLVVEWNV